MTATEWWREAVVYENHLPSLRDGNGDGIGDLEGLIESLDYLGGSLGVDAVWVGPCYRSPLLDQGFDITDFTDVEPTFGDLATFDRLIEEAHRRGVRIIVDYIPNHTSDQHPWFLASRSSREDPRRDWYAWADPAPHGGPPPGAGSAHTYQSRLGSSRDERDATNQGCWSDVWLGTKSSISFIPRACVAASSESKSAIVPNSGSMSR